MNIADSPMLSMIREKMSWLNARQGVLSQNVANADTPGYEAHDLKPIDFEDALRKSEHTNSSGLMTTDARHIAMQPSSPDSFDQTTTRLRGTDSKGNTVAIEEEMIKVADTQAQYQAAANLYSKAIALMRTAIGHGG